MTGCLAGRARAFGATSCFTASARSAPGTRPGRDMLTTLPPGEGSSHYVHTAIKSRSLNGHGADLADTPGTWTCTALFGGILYCEPCGDLEHGETSGADHGYESYTRTACAAEIFPTPPPFYWCATAGPRACSLLETVHSRIRGLHTWTVWMAPLTDGTMVACAIIVCTLVGGRRPAWHVPSPTSACT